MIKAFFIQNSIIVLSQLSANSPFSGISFFYSLNKQKKKKVNFVLANNFLWKTSTPSNMIGNKLFNHNKLVVSIMPLGKVVEKRK